MPRVVTPPVGTLGNEPADWLRRLGVSNETPPGAGSRLRTDPTAAVPRSSIIFDPTAAHVPDPVDPSKQMIVGRDVGPDTYDPNHPDAVQFQH